MQSKSAATNRRSPDPQEDADDPQHIKRWPVLVEATGAQRASPMPAVKKNTQKRHGLY